MAGSDFYLCLYMGDPHECQLCGGWIFADGGPFPLDERFCSEDCFNDMEDFIERYKKVSDWCKECGYDNFEHGEDCINV